MNASYGRMIPAVKDDENLGPLESLILVLLASISAIAQVDFTGEWAPIYHEDQSERIPGPALGDYLGLPLTTLCVCVPIPGTPTFKSMPEAPVHPASRHVFVPWSRQLA